MLPFKISVRAIRAGIFPSWLVKLVINIHCFAIKPCIRHSNHTRNRRFRGQWVTPFVYLWCTLIEIYTVGLAGSYLVLHFKKLKADRPHAIIRTHVRPLITGTQIISFKSSSWQLLTMSSLDQSWSTIIGEMFFQFRDWWIDRGMTNLKHFYYMRVRGQKKSRSEA